MDGNNKGITKGKFAKEKKKTVLTVSVSAFAHVFDNICMLRMTTKLLKTNNMDTVKTGGPILTIHTSYV